MNVSVFRFPLMIGITMAASVIISGVSNAQDAKAETKAKPNAGTYFLNKVGQKIHMRNQQRDLFKEHLKDGLEDAYYSLPRKGLAWNPSEEVDSSLISDYWIGVQCDTTGSTTISPKEASGAELTVNGGMKILAVTEGGAAEASGLAEGDVLLKFAGKDMNSLNELYAAIGETKDNETSMLVVRDRELVSMKITPQERPKKTEEVAANLEVKNRLLAQATGLWTVQEAMQQEAMAKQLPEGYRLQVELVRGKDVTVKAIKGDETWNANSDSIGDLPEPIQSVASDIFTQCEPMVTLNRDKAWVMGLQAAISPTWGYPHQLPLIVNGEESSQLNDIRRDIEQLVEAVKKLEEKLDDE